MSLSFLDKNNRFLYNLIMEKVKNKIVLVGISGGVDSSVAAKLLLDRGFDVVGAHFTFDGNNSLDGAQAVCDLLNIPLIHVDFSKEFNELVFEPFLNAYKSGLTPNICVLCNREIKFGKMLDLASEYGCDFIATGHYCKIEEKEGRLVLVAPKDKSKDQTYFLNAVTEDILKRVIFPLQDLTKEEVREIAKNSSLPTASKKGSSDICIAKDIPFKTFIENFIPKKRGKIKTESGEIVGEHDGHFKYTLGQRKGLNLGGKAGEDGGRWFIVEKRAKENEIIVTHGNEEKLFKSTFFVEKPNFINGKDFLPIKSGKFNCLVKTRFRQMEKPCEVEFLNTGVKVELLEKERATTLGQFAVFYLDGVCLGGGEITKVD